jgi:hypothetical protein
MLGSKNKYIQYYATYGKRPLAAQDDNKNNLKHILWENLKWTEPEGSNLYFGFDFRQAQETFLFFIAPKPALEFTHPLIQRVPGTISQGIKRQWRKADLSPLSGVEIKTGEFSNFAASPPSLLKCTERLMQF